MDKNKINNNKYTYLVENDEYDDNASKGKTPYEQAKRLKSRKNMSVDISELNLFRNFVK